jgi:hypothetical protein
MQNEWWGVITVVGVWGWTLTGIGFILKAFPGVDRFDKRGALIWGGTFLFFYAIWVMGMMNA